MDTQPGRIHSNFLAATVTAVVALYGPTTSAAPAAPDSKKSIIETKVSRTVEAEATFMIPAAVKTGRLDAAPVGRAWEPGEPIRFVPKKTEVRPEPGDPINPIAWTVDPLLDKQRTAHRGPGTFETPSLNFAGNAFSGSFPPDTNGDVGTTRYVQAINAAGGTAITAWEKNGALDFGPVTLATALGSGVCATGLGDPIILFDEAADRWLLSEFSAVANALCVYVSQTADVGGSYFGYVFTTPNFPDYPKYAIWPDAYVVTSNESGPSPIYVLDRAAMLTGAAAVSQRLIVSDLSGFGFQALTPVDFDGTPPPPGTPAYLIRHRDDERHNPGSNDPAFDFLELYELTVDLAGTSSLTGPFNIPITEFDSELCGFFSFQCFPQPNGQQLDPLREVVMWRASYRNFGSHQSIIGNLTTDINGTDTGGVRWFELINTGGGWTLRQDGTLGSTGVNRWMGSTAMDVSGNIAMGYSLVNSTTPTQMLYSGRLDDAPFSALSSIDNSIIAGSGSQSAERWGDYSSMSVDPVDGCTFWHTNEYVASPNVWQTRIAAFRFADCGGPPQFCGNGVTDGVEECDDGNTQDGDGCSASCTNEVGLSVCQNENFDAGIGPGYTTFNTGVLPVDWGTTDDGVCFSNNLPGPPAPNVTGGAGEAACIDSDQAGTSLVESYLCGPVVVPNGPQVSLEFNFNYQIFQAMTPEDEFSVLVGTIPPSAASIGTYSTEFTTATNQGGFAALPGVSQSIDLSAYAAQGMYYCFKYSADFDWYAQVDDVRLLSENDCQAPNPEIAIEKTTNGVDADDPSAGDAPIIAPFDLVSWDFTATNTGNVTLIGITINDFQLGGVVCTESALAPGQSTFCNSSQNAEDLSMTSAITVPGVCDGVPGSRLYQNVAEVSAIAPDGNPIFADDFSHYCNPPLTDTDTDGIPDPNDNCILQANPSQLDADGDGIGNFCDPDFDQNCSVNFLDVSTFAAAFNSNDPVVDLDGSGAVNFLDLFILQNYFLLPPGPSGIPNACP